MYKRKNKMANIGIITCSNTTQNADCSSFMCLQTLNDEEGPFARYRDQGGARLMGIISCAGCPTAVAPERLLRRIRALTELGLDAVHISSCVLALCPFQKKYIRLLEENFPELSIIQGTHDDSAEGLVEWFRATMKEMLTQPQRSMADLIRGNTEGTDGT